MVYTAAAAAAAVDREAVGSHYRAMRAV